MIYTSRIFISLVFVACSTQAAFSAVIIDGSRTGDSYGTPISVQSVETSFGDHDGFLVGSELDAAYVRIENGKLNLLLTGNLEDNFNKLVLFFDSKPGGQNILDTDTANGGINPVVDPSPFPPDPGMFAKMAGFFPTVFDAGFAADYVLILRHGFTGFVNRFDVDYAVLGGGASQYLGVFDPTAANSGTTGTGANTSAIEVGFDNSNIAGVVSGTGAANQVAAAAVTTGIEIALSLSDLGNPLPGDVIKVTAFITNSNHDYVSNQFLGGLSAPQGSLGSDGFGNFEANKTSFDLTFHNGEQFFGIPIIPEPSTFVLIVLAVLGLIAHHRKPV